MRFGGVEVGGTKVLVAAGSGPDDLSDVLTIPTTEPDPTLTAVTDALDRLGPLDAVGVASFGPLDVRLGSATAGRIIATPKPNWTGIDVVGALRSGTGLPVAFDVDVNGAALGEAIWGAGRWLHTFVYVTVGTGIGGGALVDGRLLHGANHPEMGHLRVPRHPDDDYAGACPFHGDCLEGLAAGPAIEGRFGRRGEDLGEDTERATALAAWYLGAGLANIAFTISPQRIVVGGGVSKLPGLLDAARRRFDEVVAGYLPQVDEDFVRPPALGDLSGVLGAIALALQASEGSAPRGGQ